MNLEIRPVSEPESVAFVAAVARGFGSDLDDHKTRRYAPLARRIGVFDGEAMVGTLGDFDFDVTVPGGAALPMAGTTTVTVLPTHRRRGILTSLMRRHLDEIVERGDPLAGLWASEAAIYPRFGYGCAVDRLGVELDANAVSLPAGPPEIEVRLVETEEAAKLIPEVYERVRPTRAGILSRTDVWWDCRYFDDPEGSREGMTAHRHAIAMRAEQPVGYVSYRQKAKWDDWIANGKVDVEEVAAVDDDARRALWSFLTHIDLYPMVDWWNAPVDDPMILEASNRRRVERKILDTLWIRLVDLPQAVQGRRYESAGRIVLDVADAFLPANQGVYEIIVDSGEATCRRVSAKAEVAIGVDDLGALYMGGRSATQLAAAGRIAGPPEAVTRLDRIFRTSVAPWCPEVF